MEKRIKKPSLLSASLPDVSLVNYYNPHQQLQTSRNLSPLSDTPAVPSSDLASSVAHLNIDDDLWAETADPETGSVFFVAADKTPSSRGVVPSSSSSSLSSSNPSIPDILPASPIATNVQMARGFEESLSSSRGHHRHHAFSSEMKSLSHSMHKKVQGMRHKKLRKKNEESTTSMSDLNQRQIKKMHSHSSHSSSDLSIPQGAQHGSMGASLEVNTSPFVGHKIKLELDMSQLHHCPFPGGDTGDPGSCSLEALGIVAARVLGKGRFRSNLSHHFSLRSEKKDQRQKMQSSLPHSFSHLPVVVKGVRSGSLVSRTSLKPGDTILAVNGHHVHMDNVDSVLATLSTCKTLEFRVKKGLSHPPHSYSATASPSSSTALLSPPQTPSHGGLVRLVAGGRGAGGALRPRQFRRPHRHPHLLLYVTLDTKEDDPLDEDILFCYPSQEVRQGVGDMDGSGSETGRRRKELEEKLLKLRGVFLTLSDSLFTITEHKSHTNSAVVLDGQLFFLSFSQHDKEMLLLVLPALLVSQYQLQLLLENMEHMMILLHGSVRRALTTSSYGLSVEHLVGLMLDTILSDETLPRGPAAPLLGVPSVPYLKLPTDVTVTLHAFLSDLEAADHGNQPAVQSVCRPFLMLGSCLLNRGALACSHLSSAHMEKVALFLHAYRLIELTTSEKTSQIVIWQEVFLPVDQLEESPLSEESRECRVFLLVVGLEQMLLCMLMQEVQPLLLDHTQFPHSPSVDAMYIDRGRGLLVQLKAQELLSRDFEEITSLPCLQTADAALSALSNRLTSQLTRSSSHRSSPQISKKKRGLDAFSVRSLSMRRADARHRGSESDEEGVPGTGSSPPQRSHSMLSQRRTFRQRNVSLKHHLGGVPLGEYHKEQRTHHNANSLTAGLDDMLLHYVCLKGGCGLMLCPTHTTPPGTVHSELLLCFQSSASHIREVLRGRASGSTFREDSEEEEEEEDDEDDVDSEGSDFDMEKSFKPPTSSSPFIPQRSSVIEHGILLECSTAPNVKVRSCLQYWVIGRYFTEEDRELYVCCQESTSHNTIEMAFKLLFGWPG